MFLPWSWKKGGNRVLVEQSLKAIMDVKILTYLEVYLWTQTFLFLWLWMWYVKLLIMWLINLCNSVHVFKSGDSNFLFSFSIILMRKAALMYSDRNIQNNMVVLDFACLSSVCMYSTFIQYWINKCFQCKLNLHLFSMFIVNK